ncbi:MAG: HAMP domain-containing histidine kinase [Flavobacteriales bacterium]|nr:HAMP domain-containing histidine kinase [Flavobacteriales bacterium]
MNSYSKKQLWKYILGIIALLIIGFSFWHTSQLAGKIELEERQKVRLWADAIRKKANLVKYTNELFVKIGVEERNKVELWAEATKKLASSEEIQDYTFVLKVVADNTTVPVILADDEGNVVSYRNLEGESVDPVSLKEQMQLMGELNEPIEISIYGGRKNYLYYKDSRLFAELKHVLDDLVKSFISEIVVNSASVPVLFMDESKTEVLNYGNVDAEIVEDKTLRMQLINEMISHNDPILVDLGEGQKSYIFYQDSDLLRQLTYYPFIQFGVIGLFVLVSYFLFNLARRAEQNQVWVGLAKETAHQLGTPLSSLMAWVEILKSQGVDASTTDEMSKDVRRLETITDRFSKIGSTPKLEEENIYEVLEKAVDYIGNRTSSKVKIEITSTGNIPVHISVSLFNWVIENLCKNAIDAMGGNGNITIDVSDQKENITIDITDTGKGIPSGKHKAVFEPGFTTKQRGWGLGLSLTKRIIEDYHKGKIVVHKSKEKKGTTFRIVLNK